MVGGTFRQASPSTTKNSDYPPTPFDKHNLNTGELQRSNVLVKVVLQPL